MTRTHDFINCPVEFDYDDGSFHALFIETDRVREEQDFDHSHEMIYLDVFTSIRDNTERAIKVWAKEVEASAEETAAKKERISGGKQAWEHSEPPLSAFLENLPTIRGGRQ